ncbi:MAG: hypothetical protein M5R37_15170 [Melioribacteraceae bacterium]|nr:hypothetical protein [Melioribacteraceae bacterium]
MTYRNGDQNLLDFYLDTSEESIEEVKESLTAIGIDPVELTDRLKNKLNRMEVELRLEKAKLKQKAFDEFISKYSFEELKEKFKTKVNHNPKAAYAFNKLESLSDANMLDSLDDEIKLLILKELGESDDE